MRAPNNRGGILYRGCDAAQEGGSEAGRVLRMPGWQNMPNAIAGPAKVLYGNEVRAYVEKADTVPRFNDESDMHKELAGHSDLQASRVSQSLSVLK